MDSVTILTGTKLAAKVIRSNAKPEVLLPASWFRWEVVPVASLADFHALLVRVTANPRSLIIRDRPKSSLVPSNMLRRIKENFDPIDHHWLMVDMDGTEAPPGQSPTSLHTVDWLIRKHLPPAFHHADYIAHFSSSAGTLYAGNKIKVHVIFFLAQPANSRDLRDWAYSVGADPALFHPVQPHFVADPIFEGCPDPLKGMRLFHVQKGLPEINFVPPAVAAVRRAAVHKSNGGGATGLVRNASGLIIDGREGWLLKHLYSILARRVDGGESIAFADVETEAWADFQAECDLSGWDRAAVGGKVHATLERHKHGSFPALRSGAKAGMTPHYVLLPTPIGTIRAALATAGNDFFAQAVPGDVVVLAAPPGSGKSTMVQRELRNGGATCDYYAPTLALAEAVALAIGPAARVIRGRGAEDPSRPGMMTCDRHVVAAEMSKAGLSVSTNLCRGCPFRGSCSYLAQWENPPRVLVMAHNYLALPRPGSVRRADYIVIDEAFLGTASVQGHFPLSELAIVATYSLQKAIRDGLENGKLLETLDVAGITPDMIRAAQKGIFAERRSDIKGTMPDAEIFAKLGKRHAPTRLSGFLGWLARELEAMKPIDAATEVAAQTFMATWMAVWFLARDIRLPWWFSSWGIHFLHELFRATPLRRGVSHVAWSHGGEVRVSYPRRLHRLEGQPILHIDGTADREIAERLLGPCDFKRWDAVRHATMYQVTDHANSKSRLSENPEWLNRVACFAGRLTGKTFLCLQKEPRRALTGETGDKLPVPSDLHPHGLDIFHFGQTTGLNGFDDHDNAVIIGRMQPPPYAIEAFRGLFWNDPTPLLLTGAYVYEDRGYAGGSGSGVTVQVHPEARLEAYLEQAREAGVVQALDRLRLCDPSTSPRAVFVFGNLPIRVAPDCLVDEASLIPEWLDLMDAAGGVLIDSPKALSAMLPLRFPTPKGAENWLSRGGSSVPWGGLCQNPSDHPKDYYREMRGFVIAPPLTAAVYRPAQKRMDRVPKQGRAVSWLNVLDFFTFLRKQLMKPLEVAFKAAGVDVWITQPTEAEIISARHAAERLAIHNADPEASARRNEAEAAKAVLCLVLEGSRLADLPPLSRAEILRDIGRVPAKERASCMTFAVEWAKVAIATFTNMDKTRREMWLRWGPVNLTHMAEPMSEEESYQTAREAAAGAEALLEVQES